MQTLAHPQARGEVVGQILDYVRALARFSYEDLRREVSRSKGRSGNALYQMVAGQVGVLDEARLSTRSRVTLPRRRNLAEPNVGKGLLSIGGGYQAGSRNVSFGALLAEKRKFTCRPNSGPWIAVSPGEHERSELGRLWAVRYGGGAVIAAVNEPRSLPSVRAYAIEPVPRNGRQCQPQDRVAS